MLKSPFQSPKAPHSFTDVSHFNSMDFDLTQTSNNFPAVKHVTLSQIELSPSKFTNAIEWDMSDEEFSRFRQSLDDDAFPTYNETLNSEQSKSFALTFNIDERGRASVGNALDSSIMREQDPVFMKCTSHDPSLQNDFISWTLSSRVLGMSSSPDTIKEVREPTECSEDVFEREADEFLSSSPPVCPGVPHIDPTLPIPEEDKRVISPVRLKKRKNRELESPVAGGVRVMDTSDITSDVDSKLVNLDRHDMLALRSKEQVEKVMLRGIKRANIAAMQIKHLQERKSGEPESSQKLAPVRRSSTVRTIHGMGSRCEALEKILGKEENSKPLKGYLKCNCNSFFKSFMALASHLDKDHDFTARPFECPVRTCPWSVIGFSHLGECARHVSSAHDSRKFACEICEISGKEKLFARTDALRRHLAQTHNVKSVEKKQEIHTNFNKRMRYSR